METEIINTIPLTITPKKIKYLDIHLKHVQDTYAENHKIMTEEIKEDPSEWRDK